MTYDLVAFLNDCKTSNIDPDDSIYEASCTVDVGRLLLLRQRIEQVRLLTKPGASKRAKKFRGTQSRHVGLLLERLMLQLLSGCSVLSVGTNIRSTMAEIDYLVQFGPAAFMFPMFRDAGSHSIGEAKCVAGNLKTEWVNEMAGLLPAHGATLGLLFTAAPSKKIYSGCRTAIAVHAARGFKIVPFGFKQLDEVIAGRSFLKVLAEQYVRATCSVTALEI